MPIKTDAQVLRSKQWMLDALLALMNEKPFSQITVSEIAEKAQLDRRTFYRHFKMKEDIISYRIRQLAARFEPHFHQRAPLSTRKIALVFFSLCQAEKEFMGLLYANQLLPLLLYEMNALFWEHHHRYHGSEGLYAPYDDAYAISYHVGGFWNVLLRWFADGMEKTPEELSDTIASFLPEMI